MPASTQPSNLSTVVDCNGVSNRVDTNQSPGESVDDFQNRHLADVAATRASCQGTATVEPAIYTTPVDCNGSVNDVRTQQDPGQSMAGFFAQHNANVRTAVNDCP